MGIRDKIIGIVYPALILLYGVKICTDIFSSILIFITLMRLSSYFKHKHYIIISELILLIDLIMKLFISTESVNTKNLQQFDIDLRCILAVQSIFKQGTIYQDAFIYLFIHLFTVYALINIFNSRNQKTITRLWGPLMTQISNYLLPIILYSLSLSSANQYQRTILALIACLNLLQRFQNLSHWMCCLIIAYQSTLNLQERYSIKIGDMQIQRKKISSTIYTLMILVILFLHVNKNPDREYSRTNRTQVRKKQLLTKLYIEQKKKHKSYSFYTLLVTVILCLMTNSLGNIFILLAVYTNIPNYKAKRFSYLMGLGLLTSVALEPLQITYFIYLFVVVFIIQQDLKSEYVVQFQMHSSGIFLHIYRIYLMLNHVSFLNFILGLLRSSLIVLITLAIRISFRYLDVVIVFLGTNDSYGLQNSLFNLQALPDAILWAYMILMCLYSPTTAITYPDSQITNILLEYPFLNNFKKLLKILKIFNWVSIIIFSLIVLSQIPSLYISIHIVLLIVITSIQLKSSQNQNKSQRLRNVWNIIFYFTCIGIFTKYFYLLKQYNETSELIQTLIDFLKSHQYMFGLSNLRSAQEGFTLLLYFLYDITVVTLAWANIYILDFKIYAAYRIVIARNQNLQSLLHEQQQLFDGQNQILKKKNIYYFYNTYIKPPNPHQYLITPQNKLIKQIIRDCVIGSCFTIITLGYMFEDNISKYMTYIPFFFVIGLYYYLKFNQKYNPNLNERILSLLTFWSLFDLFFTYIARTVFQIYKSQPQSLIQNMIILYTITILINVISNIHGFLPQMNQIDISNEEKRLHTIAKFVIPANIRPLKLQHQIVRYYSLCLLAISFSLFLTNFFSPALTSSLTHPILMILIIVSKLKNEHSEKWLYLLSLLGLVDIWNEDFIAYFTIMFVSLFYSFRSYQNILQHKIIAINVSQMKPHSKLSIAIQNQIKKPKKMHSDWIYYMCYCTLVWQFPVILDLIWLLGVVWLSPSSVSALLIVLLIAKLIYQILFERVNWSKYIFYATSGMAAILFISQFIQFFYKQLYGSYQEFFNQGFGMFLIFTAFFLYMIIIHNNEMYRQRSNQAKAYWALKKNMVGELGSQLHNQKKILTLQQFYHSKQRLSDKVNKISDHLRLNGKQPFYNSLDSIAKERQQKPTYQLYSNMLLFLNKKTLQKCFLMLNLYIPPEMRKDDIIPKSAQMRKQIYRSYRNSFQEAFLKIKSEMQNDRQSNSYNEEESFISDEQKLDIEKISEILIGYQQCYKIISKCTQQFNPFLRFIIQNMQIISLGVVAGWNLFGGVYTIPITLAIFGWAILLQNRTNVLFWLIILIYTGFILIFKQILPWFSHNDFFNFIFYYHSTDYIYEYFVIFFSILQIIFLQLGGIQDKNYSQRESIIDSFYRSALNRASKCNRQPYQNRFMELYKDLKNLQKHSFIYRVFAKARFKPGKDFYPLMSGTQLIILLYLFFFYDMMEFESKKNRKSFQEILTITQFSSHMVIALFVQIIVMVIDRLLVSLNLVNENNQELQNFFFSFTFNAGNVKHKPPQQIDKLSSFDALLMIKYIFHLTLLLSLNFFVYFYIPSAGLTKSLIPSCTNNQCSKSYFYLSIFLFLYLIYFMVSGLQIKHGFNRNKCKNVLMEKYHYINYYVYKAFTGIPFAWQFKKICDWTVTSTALPLFHWMKFEDINAKMYQSKCQAQMIKIKALGTPWNKYLLGPLGFISILLLIFGPILVYSPANPFSIKDTIIGAQTKLYLLMDNRYDYKFFSTSHAIIDQNIDNDFGVDLTDKNLFLIRMSQYPDENFLFSQPAVAKLCAYMKQTLNKTSKHQFKFVFELKIIEHEGGQSTIKWADKTLNNDQILKLLEMLTYSSNQFILKNFYSPFPGQVDPYPMKIQSLGVGQYFEISLITQGKQKHIKQKKPIYFYYLTSNKFRLGFGIITFYLTYVLLISRLLRFYLTQSVNNTLYDGCYMQSILMLCEAVREARIVQNFIEQQKLYFELVDLMRYPRALKQITGDFKDFRKKYI